MKNSIKKIGAMLSATLVSGATLATNPTYYRGDWIIEGPWSFEPDAVKSHYNVPVGRFGTFQILMPDGKSAMDPDEKQESILRELHYRICSNDAILDPLTSVSGVHNQVPRCTEENGRALGWGVRPIPIVDRGDEPVTMKSPDGKSEKTIVGSEVLDQFLRESFYAKSKTKVESLKNGPIFAIIAYHHPENPVANFLSLGDPQFLKTENSITHLGAYIGDGQTRNSPVFYHDFKWSVRGYPSLAYTVQYKGSATQEIFNENAKIALQLLNELNEGPNFPGDYKFDHFRSVNLKETLAFYRAWIDPTWIRKEVDETKPFLQVLKENDLFATYCAEHITIALNVALNVPQNQKGYEEIWGTDGIQLWSLAQKRWATERALDGQAIEAAPLAGIPEGDHFFKPLWKVEGIKNPTEAIAIGKSLAWEPESTAHILRDFLTQYANWTIVNPVLTTAIITGFAPNVKERTGTDESRVLALAEPVLERMYIHYAAYKLSRELDKQEKLVQLRDAEFGSESSSIGADVRVAVQKRIKRLKRKVANELTKHEFRKQQAYSQILEKYKDGISQVLRNMEDGVTNGLNDPSIAQILAEATTALQSQRNQNPTDEEVYAQLRKIHAENLDMAEYIIDTHKELRSKQASIETRKAALLGPKGLIEAISSKPIENQVYEEALRLFAVADANRRMEWAYNTYQKEIQPFLKVAFEEKIENSFEDQYKNPELAKQVQYYTPPAAIFRVVNGIHQGNQHVRFRAVGTVMDALELRLLNDDVSRIQCDPHKAPLKVENLEEGQSEDLLRGCVEVKK